MRGRSTKSQKLDICSSGFSSKGWLLQCNSSLVCTSAGIDELCSAIVLTKNVFHSDLTCHVSRELGDLALTVAALERSVYDYAKRIRLAHKRSASTDSTQSDDSTSGKEVLSQQYLDDHKYLWKHPGAVMSLLDLLTDCMEQLESLLKELQNESSLSSFISKNKILALLVVTAPTFFQILSHRKHSLRFLKIAGIRLNITSFLFRGIVAFVVTLYLYKLSMDRKYKRLRILHLRLSTLMRFWHLCMSEVAGASDVASIPSGSPQTKEIASSKQKPPKGVQISISKWMLDLVGVGTIWYDYMYDVDRDLWFLWYTYSILYSSVSVWYSSGGNSIRWYCFPVALLSSFYYALRPRLAAATASELLSSMYSEKRGSTGMSSKSRRIKLSHIKNAWIFYDKLISEWKRKWSWLWGSLLRNSFNLALKSKFTLWPLRWLSFYSVSVLGLGPSGIRIKPVVSDSESDSFSHMISIVGSKPWQKARSERLDQKNNPVLIYIHGGGWVANFLNSDLTFLNDWSDECDIPIVVFDYSLSRKKKFSYIDALKQSLAAYEYVASGGIGFSPSSILLAGDSVGARIAIALCADLITTESVITNPSALLLAYPPLNLSLVSSPSRAIFMMDPIVPMSIMNQNSDWSKLIDDKDFQSGGVTKDSCFTILDAPDEVLKKFPSTYLMVGSIDPFVDDAVDFAHRLSSNGVICKFKVYKNLPHGFLGFQTMLPKARVGIDQAAEWIQESLDLQKQEEVEIPVEKIL